MADPIEHFSLADMRAFASGPGCRIGFAVAPAVPRLASEAGSFTTSQTIVADGGTFIFHGT